jgi:molybdopterin/thiamine biosynthesis adenylyltransferase
MPELLSTKTALVIGAGGLGGPALLGLASAGVGHLVVVDGDAVETSNLGRQPLFTEADLGRRKAEAAVERLGRLFPGLTLTAVDGRFDEGTAPGLLAGADVVVDGSDNFETKFLASDAALRAGVPLVHGGVLRFTAQLLTVMPGTSACLRCLFEAPPPRGDVPTCAEAGVLGPLAGFAGALMGAEAARVVAGERGAYVGRLLVYEARSARARAVAIRQRADCPACPSAPRRAAPPPPPAEVTSSRAGGGAA